MALLARYDHDIYFCFAAKDNQDGWVTKLAQRLNKELTTQAKSLSKEQAKAPVGIFMDEARTEDKPLDDEVQENMCNAATMVVVLSSAFCDSARSQQELEGFLELMNDRLRDDSRIFLVEREKIERGNRPPKLYDMRGYRFWTEDAKEGTRTLSSGTEDAKEGTRNLSTRTRDDSLLYWGELHRLSTKLFGELQRIKSAEDRAAGERGEAKPEAAEGTEFDVFLCHNSQDKDAVKEIRGQLEKLGIKAWLDEAEFQPGHRWQDELDNQIKTIKSAAIFVGDEIGPWQEQEIGAFIRKFVKRNCPVIPVILQDVDEPPELPTFLEGMMWVDFRKQEPDPMEQLVWGITSEKPDWRPTVFLADVTDDLYWIRAEVAEYLDQAGLRVLPDTTLYSEDSVEFHTALDRDLSRSRLFVQLLSDCNGRQTSGMPPNFVRAQFDHAKQLGKRILQWRSRDLKLATVAKADPDHARFLTNEHVLAMKLQDFKERVEQKSREPDDAPASPLNVPKVHVYRTCQNEALSEQILQLLKEQKIACYPALADEEEWLDWVFTHLDGMLVVYNRDHFHPARSLLKQWLDRQFQTESPPELAICRCPPPNGGEGLDCWQVPNIHSIDNSIEFDANKLQRFIDAVRITATRAKV